MTVKLSEEDMALIEQLIEERDRLTRRLRELSMAKIAEKFGVDRAAIYYRLRSRKKSREMGKTQQPAMPALGMRPVLHHEGRGASGAVRRLAKNRRAAGDARDRKDGGAGAGDVRGGGE